MGVHGIPRGFSLGGFASQTPHQGGTASLGPPKYGLVTPQYEDYMQDGPVTPQDGLVTPPLGGLRAAVFKKRAKFVKNRKKLGFFKIFGRFLKRSARNSRKGA